MPLPNSDEKIRSITAKGASISAMFETELARQADETKVAAVPWPNPYYWKNPEKFCTTVMGFRPWKKQLEIMHAVRDNDRVSASTSHKIGKSAIAAVLAFLHHASVPGSRVIMTSSTNHQVQNILWREMRIRHRTAKRGMCIHCVCLEKYTRRPIDCPHGAKIEDEFSDVASTGLRADDMREVIGFTAQDAERMAGISAPHVFYICDEASGIPAPIFAAIEGNRAGGAKLLLLGNPTKNTGEFFESHHVKPYHRITVSAYDTPNAVCGYKLIEGLATREWIEEKLEDWGEDSPDFFIRVLGKFAKGEEGCTLSLDAIMAAQERWDSTPANGRLYIGVDVAGPGDQGDETTIALRRGKRCYSIIAQRGLSEEAILVNVLGYINTDALSAKEVPVVVIDSEGDIGAKVANQFSTHLAANPGAFLLVKIKASQKAVKMPTIYDLVRDDMWANMVRWIRDGGAIPADNKLAQELHFPWWETSRYNAKMKLIDKKTMRKRLKRSPDRAEALELCCWEPQDVDERARDANEERAGIVKEEPKAEAVMGHYQPADNGYSMADMLDRWHR